MPSSTSDVQIREAHHSRRALIALLGTIACGRRSSGVRIVVGGQSDLVYLPTTLAQQLGQFRACGVNATIEEVGAGSKSLQAVLGRSADVANGFYDHMIQMAADGQEIKAFVTLARYPGGVLVTSPLAAERIRGIADLKGAVVGVTAPGSSSHFFLNYLLVRHGLLPNDVRVFGMGGGRSRVAAIESNRVDAGVLFEPGVRMLLKRAPKVKILVDTRTRDGVESVFGTSEYPSAVLYASARWLDENGETARRLARAMRQTLSWIHDHSAEDIARAMPSAMMAEDAELYVEAVRNSKQLYSMDARMRPEAAGAVHKVLSTSIEKVRNTTIDVSRTYTNTFLE
jgi:NitT/TauT family transport system substrate-binding protein